MKKIYLTLLMALLLVSGVFAGIGIGALNKQRSLDETYRDELLSLTEDNEINPEVIIKCSDNYCLWNAYQDKIINSKDNKINREYCSEYEQTINEYNQTRNICLETSFFTDEEIQDIVADAVLNKLENFANASISREVYEDWATGNVEIIER